MRVTLASSLFINYSVLRSRTAASGLLLEETRAGGTQVLALRKAFTASQVAARWGSSRNRRAFQLVPASLISPKVPSVHS